MVSNTLTAAISGIEGIPVNVEVASERGLPGLNIVGLGDTAVKEAADRVRSAVINSGFEYPKGRITVNLSPGWIRKRGSHFDLPMAVGILVAGGVLKQARVRDRAFIGELSLAGELIPVRGVLPMVSGLKERTREIYLPSANRAEAALALRGTGVKVVGVDELAQLAAFLSGKDKPEEIPEELVFPPAEGIEPDFKSVKGHLLAKEAIVTAVAGGHGILLIGSPGTGKTMLARRIPTILPEMTPEEQLETSMIYSLIGELNPDRPLIQRRPFRQVSKRATEVSILGGGVEPLPGEVSLAHNGILFMDEFLEFDRSHIDSLRKPMEERRVTIMRRGQAYVFPAGFTLVAAANPCPCGYLGDETKSCVCTQTAIDRYRSKLSGPVAERIDMCVEISRVKYEHLTGDEHYSSAEMRRRVEAAREIQLRRFRGREISLNSEMDETMVEEFCRLGRAEQEFMEQAYERFSLSPRRYHKTLKLARTIADIKGSERIQVPDLAASLGYTRYFAGEDGNA